MARPLRIEYPGAWYHVTCRGNERKPVFKDDSDRRHFLEVLGTTSNLYDTEIHVFVLMDNHLHLALSSRDANLSRFMQRLNTAYTVYFNRRHQRSGHLFQGRYKAILIEADTYLLELSRYIHLNPVRIRKYSSLPVNSKRKILREYPWSSFLGYIKPENRLAFMNYSKVLGMIGSEDNAESRKWYADFVLKGILKDMNITFWEGVKGQAILGSDDFTGEIRERFLAGKHSDPRAIVGLNELADKPFTMEGIARQVAAHFGIEEGDLYPRNAPFRLARSIFMELCCFYLSRKNILQVLPVGLPYLNNLE